MWIVCGLFCLWRRTFWEAKTLVPIGIMCVEEILLWYHIGSLSYNVMQFNTHGCTRKGREVHVWILIFFHHLCPEHA